MIIKMAVKDTPALIGNKLKNHYFKVLRSCSDLLFLICCDIQGDNYFELDVDVTSSSVARNLTGLAMGYSKTIVVDLGFCLQVRFYLFLFDFLIFDSYFPPFFTG